MLNRKRRQMVGLSAMAIAGLAVMAAGEFTIDRYTIDGGGATALEGGRFELYGTVGQGDASTVMVGDSFSLTGGMWFPVNAGDCDIDGVTGLFDFDRFGDCLTGEGVAIVDLDCNCFDQDDDGDVDLVDFGSFQTSFDDQ